MSHLGIPHLERSTIRVGARVVAMRDQVAVREACIGPIPIRVRELRVRNLGVELRVRT